MALALRQALDLEKMAHQNVGMPVIADVEITDANLYGQFLEQFTGTVEAHGGKFVARQRLSTGN